MLVLEWAQSVLRDVCCVERRTEGTLLFPPLDPKLFRLLGAWLTGNKALAVEYESRAIGQMSYLSQFPQAMTDYSLAMVCWDPKYTPHTPVNFPPPQAAYVLGMYSLYFQLNAEKSREYLQMAMDICKKINALNSDVYRYGILSRLLGSLACFSLFRIPNNNTTFF